MFECYLDLPETENLEQNPLNYKYIQEQQEAYNALLELQQRYPNNYINKCMDNNIDNIICFAKDQNNPITQWKIELPKQMVKPTVEWFHQGTGHPGQF